MGRKETKYGSVANLKGGPGKTTITLCLAVTLATEFGKKVLIIDCDPQLSASKFGLLKEPPEIDSRVFDVVPVVFAEETRDKESVEKWLTSLEHEIEKADGLYDFVFIDVPGYMDNNLVTIFAYTDFVITPVVMSEMVVLSTNDFIQKTMSRVIDVKKKRNLPFQSFLMLNMITNRKSNQQIYALANEFGIPLLENGLSRREKHYDEDLSVQKGITRGNKTHEVYMLTEELLHHLNK